jgi:predicted aconitase with swiveling domain
MNWQGRVIYSGNVRGESLGSNLPISFFGGVDPDTGIVVEKGHPLEGKCISGKVLIFSTGKGSTVGSYTLYRLKKNGKAPCAIINAHCETITAVGCIIAEIPCIDSIPIQEIPDGILLEITGENVKTVQ